MSKSLLLIVLSVSLAVAGQLLLKSGMTQVGRITEVEVRAGVATLIKVGTNPQIILGLFLYVIGAATWMIVLSREDLSFAYPLLGSSYLVVLVASWALFHEPVTLLRWGGAALISLGVFLITRT